jgi:hypothetical protein
MTKKEKWIVLASFSPSILIVLLWTLVIICPLLHFNLLPTMPTFSQCKAKEADLLKRKVPVGKVLFCIHDIQEGTIVGVKDVQECKTELTFVSDPPFTLDLLALTGPTRYPFRTGHNLVASDLVQVKSILYCPKDLPGGSKIELKDLKTYAVREDALTLSSLAVDHRTKYALAAGHVIAHYDLAP